MPRLFLAVALPETLRAALVATQRRLAARAPGVRWTSAGTMHLTVRFLGEDDPDRIVAAVGPAVAAVPAFEATVVGGGGFGGHRRPAVLWVGVRPPEPLAALDAAVTSALGPPDRPFRPHITIGRQRKGRPPALDDVGFLGTLPVDALTLYECELRHDGAVHTARATLPLHSQPLSATGPW